jgi:hypothetical protein
MNDPGEDGPVWPYRDLEGLDPAALVQANMGADFLAALKQQVIGDSSQAEWQ